MTSDPKFVLDANVFIHAAREYYAFDILPPFWKSLVQHAAKGRIQSIDRVKSELEHQTDALATWAEGDFHQAFASTDDPDVLQAYAEIMNWANAQERFTGAAKADFASGADGWLVAYALAKSYIVVTHEQSAPEARHKIKIPDVCQKFDVPYNNTFKMMRMLGMQFR